MPKHNTYERDPAAVERARLALLAAKHDPDKDTSWADNLPPDDLPEDDEDVVAEFIPS